MFFKLMFLLNLSCCNDTIEFVVSDLLCCSLVLADVASIFAIEYVRIDITVIIDYRNTKRSGF